MKIIHTADWHLGRIFHGVHLTEDQAHILQQFVDLVKDCHPDAVIVAGDIYDRAVPPPDAVKLLDDILSRIILECKVPIVMIAGNHDSPERLGFGKGLLSEQNLHIRGVLDHWLTPVVMNDDDGPVYFFSLPYAEPSVMRDKLALEEIADHNSGLRELTDQIYHASKADTRKIMIAHAFVSGCEPSDSERPLSIGGSEKVDTPCFQHFHYTALGHLHRPQTVHLSGEKKKNFQENRIHYAGSLFKYSFLESNHKKTVSIIEMRKDGKTSIEEIALTPRRDIRCIEGYLDNILSNAPKDGSREDYLMVTLRDKGAILDVMGKLRREYPNVLHLERPQFRLDRELKTIQGDHREIGEKELFEAFFKEMTGDELSDEEERIFVEQVDDLRREQREANS